MQFNLSSANQYVLWLKDLFLTYLPQLVIAIVVLVVGWFIAKFIKRTVRRILYRTKLDKAVSLFLTQIVYIALIVFVILIAINQLGISTTPITGAIVGMMVGIGMSLKSSVTMITSGVILVSSRPFKIGEFVDIGGTMGTVEDINFIYCTLRTTDGREVKMPNAVITSRIITNYSNNEFRRNDFVIGIGYDSDLKKAKEILQKLVNEDERILKTEEKPFLIKVDTLGDSSVDILVRYWTKRADFLETKWHITEQSKLLFDQNDIEIPFPQRQVHFSKESSASA